MGPGPRRLLQRLVALLAVLLVWAWRRQKRALAFYVARATAHRGRALAAGPADSLEPAANVLKSVRNFRDVAHVSADDPLCAAVEPGPLKLKRGVLFRSANPRGIENADLRVLERCGLKGVLDLRDQSEQAAEDTEYAKKMDPIGAFRTTPGKQLKRVNVIPKEQWMMRLLPVSTAASVALSMLSGNKDGAKKQARAVLGQFVRQAGLRFIYVMFLDGAPQGFREALDFLCEKDNLPCLVHCTAGKDRTGLVCALAQCAVGVPRDQILAQYALSQRYLVGWDAPEGMRKALGNDPEVISGSPTSALQFVFEHFDEKYGGPLGYLDTIGFGAAQRAKLRQALVE